MGRRSLKTLLSQSAAGGALGCFLMLCGKVVWHPSGYNFFVVLFFPIYLFYGALVGISAGTVIWVLQKLCKISLRLLFRVVIAVLFTTLVLAVLFGEGISIDQQSLIWFIPGISLGLPIGMLTGSNVRPWRLIACGTAAPPKLKVLFSKGPIRISRTTEELGGSFLMGLPLRVASLVGLMVSLLLVACALSFLLWDDWWDGNPTKLIEPLFATAYFVATFCVSSTIRRKSLLLTAALLLNLPLFVWMVESQGRSTDINYVINIAGVFIGFWLLFVLGAVALPKNKGQLQVEYGHAEIRFGKQQWVKESQ